MLFPFTVQAQSALSEAGKDRSPGPDRTLPTVHVTADRETATSPVDGYRASRAVTATKTDTSLSETPQSVTIVTRDQMIDQGATSLPAAMNYAAGVRTDAWGLDSRDDGLLIRGTSPSIYLDGLQQYSAGWYTATTRPDPYTLERIEVLRGPSGMLFGAGTAAGVVNLVSKRPLSQTRREIGVQIGNHGRRQIQTDLTGPLTDDGQLSYRLVALHRDSDTQVDYVPDDRSLVAPSLTWRPNAATSVTLQAYWQKDHTGSTSQFLPWSGTLLANPNGQLPSSRFIGEPGDRYDSSRRSIGWLAEHRFNDQWAIRQHARFASNTNLSSYHYADFWTLLGGWGEDPINQRLIGRVRSHATTRTRIAGVDNHLQGRFDTGPVRHSVLIGADYSRQRQTRRNGSADSVIDAYAPIYGITDTPVTELIDQPATTQRNAGVYVQDQLRYDNWIVVAGLRHDRSKAEAVGDESETTRANTKRLGLMYAFPTGWAPYLSYTESFTPEAGRTEAGALFKPLRGEQVEAGIKYAPAHLPVAAAASVYRLKEKNRTIADPMNPDFGLQVGASENRGVELEARATVGSALELIAYYTYIDLDRKLGGVPRSQAALWGKYHFSIGAQTGFEFGAGTRFFGSFTDTTETDSGPRIPSATLFDFLLAWNSARWRLALNVNNATDKAYFSTCLARGDCWWAPRRTVVASMTYRF